ncbi:MAG: VTT domain-containing protein [Gammaproteobacteria bacterium]|nr:VTT domain-containing protein [Gammaproteobacteria bacterium]
MTMTLDFLQSFLDWLTHHSVWSGLIIFLIAFSESLALVGLIVPGALLMFAIGTLISTGHLPFVSTCLWAVAGAVIGDGTSYWLGNYYRDNLKNLWPLSRHPQILDRGSEYFKQHGGKSIFLGRFIGPLRPIIPAIAGMNNMPIPRFMIVNIISGFAWAPLYLLPGMAFGLSLTVASEVAGRLVMLSIVLIVLTLVFLWLSKRIYKATLPRVDKLFFNLMDWSHRHPIAGQVPAALIKPEHPEVRILSLLALLLLFASAMLIGISQLMGPETIFSQLDKLIHFNLQRLHTPGFSSFMQYVQGWASPVNLSITVALFIFWYWSQHNRLVIGHVVAALLVPWLLITALSTIFPLDDRTYVFPALPVTVSISVYGFIAVALARELPQKLHPLIYVPVAVIVFLISFAQLYQHQYSLSDVVIGAMVGAIWLAILGIAYRRHAQQPYIKARSITFIIVVMCLSIFVIAPGHKEQSTIINFQHIKNISAHDWLSEQWTSIDLHRKDLRFLQHHPLNIQLAGNLDRISATLQKNGWRVPPSARGLGVLQWLNPAPELERLPVLPHVHDGQYEKLRMVKHTGNKIYVIRLWHTRVKILNGNQSLDLWVGNAGALKKFNIMGLSMFKTDHQFYQAMQLVKNDINESFVIQQKILPEDRNKKLLLAYPAK